MSLSGQGSLGRRGAHCVRCSSVLVELWGTLGPEAFLATGTAMATADEARGEGDGFLLAAAELEGRAALDAVAADVSHELAHTLGFLRCLLIPGSAELSAEDRELANVEAERIQRLMRQLLRLNLAAPDGESVEVLDLLRKAQVALAAASTAKRIAVVLNVPSATLRANCGLLYIAVRDMLAMVIARAALDSSVTVYLTLPQGAAPGALEISSSAQDAAAPLGDPFDLWNAHADSSTLLGLGVAYRIARTWGWTLSLSGAGAGLHLSIPGSAFHSGPA